MKVELFWLFFVTITWTVGDYSPSDLDENQKKVAYIEGDFVIGALFPVHEKPISGHGKAIICGDVREQYGIQRVEAALWVIQEINRFVSTSRHWALPFVPKKKIL